MSCDWEGNRRSGVALAMRHRLQWLMALEWHTNAYTLQGYYNHFLQPFNGLFSRTTWAICKSAPGAPDR